MEEKLTKYLSTLGRQLDVRIQKDARWIDQKCTPDVLCFIADCIVNGLNPENKSFKVKDIWDSQYFIKNARAVFNKPWPTNAKAHSEYDKFIQQPLRLLAYAHVLKITRGGGHNTYEIEYKDFLEYISLRERNAFTFLACYIEKVLEVSGILSYFDKYRVTCKEGTATINDYFELRDRFVKFTIGNTNINTPVEVRRIFPKVLNVYAVKHGIKGSERGRISTYPYSFSDLMYNRVNWRDLNKDKRQTRQEAAEEATHIQQVAYNEYYMQKAMNLLRKIQHESEVHDQWGKGEATQVHHIFPKSQFPSIAHYIENLIKLTATQHYTKAHPNNRTQVIAQDYQLICILAKTDTIQKSIAREGEKYYRKESLIYVVNTGLDTKMSTNVTFEEIKKEVILAYNS